MTTKQTTVIQDIREYLRLLESKGLLEKVQGVDWNIELGALSEVMAFSPNPRALLFDSIKGYPKGYQVATDLYVSPKLQGLALGLPENASGIALVQAWRERTHTMKPLKPKEVTDGPVKENIVKGDKVDIFKFPVPFWHEGDGGRFFGTGDCFITKDPDEGWVNVGTYRSQAFDKNTLGLLCVPPHHGMVHIQKYWDKGKDAPVVIVEGSDPSLYGAACMPLPYGSSELDFAGGLMGTPEEVIMDDETGLPVPARAEIAAFGHLVKGEYKDEGPFGECTGYCAPMSPKPTIHIDRIWHRNNPIYQGNPPMRGVSAMIHALGAELVTSASAWDSIEKEVQGVTGVYSLFQPCQAGSPFLVVSIKQRYAGHARTAALAALTAHAVTISGKIIVVVDDDIDAADIRDVLWAITSRCNPGEDIDTIKGTGTSVLDPALSPAKRQSMDFTSQCLIIDATKKPFGLRDKYPRTNRISRELEAKIKHSWGSKLHLGM